MKTKILKVSKISLTLLTSIFSIGIWATQNQYDYAYIMTSKNPKLKRGEQHLHFYVKNNDTKEINFNGKVIIPEEINISSPFVDKNGKVKLTFDNIINCEYKFNYRRFLSGTYSLDNCSSGIHANETQRVTNKIKFQFITARTLPSAAILKLKVIERFVKGIKLPQLEASNGQILKFDGEMWVPSDYIPDGNNSGDILTWDGAQWVATALQSLKGDKGDKGDQGEQGLQGIAGAKGDKGDQGAQGIQGLAGPMGAQGLQGVAGTDGATGAKGDKGDKGDQGAQGIQGLAGPMGPQGLQGVAGADGATGTKGDKGDKGDQGAQGIQGNPGLVSLTAGIGILNGTGAGGAILGNGGVIAIDIGTNAGQVPMIEENGKLNASIIPSTTTKMVIIKDIKPSGTSGGGCDQPGIWYTRTLNTVYGDTSFMSLNNNQVTLQPGRYLIEGFAPAYLSNIHKAALFNSVTDAVAIIGSNGRTHITNGGSDSSIINGFLTLTEEATYDIRHRCSVTKPLDGFGVAANFGINETYTQLKITKLD